MDTTKLTATAAKALAALGALWIHFPPMLWTLILLMTIDYVTGLATAWGRGEVQSSKARLGLARKIGMLGAAAAFYLAQRNVPEALGAQFLPQWLEVGTMICGWLVITELVSIVENLDRLGVKLPPWLRQALAKFNDEQSKKEDPKP